MDELRRLEVTDRSGPRARRSCTLMAGCGRWPQAFSSSPARGAVGAAARSDGYLVQAVARLISPPGDGSGLDPASLSCVRGLRCAPAAVRPFTGNRQLSRPPRASSPGSTLTSETNQQPNTTSGTLLDAASAGDVSKKRRWRAWMHLRAISVMGGS